MKRSPTAWVDSSFERVYRWAKVEFKLFFDEPCTEQSALVLAQSVT